MKMKLFGLLLRESIGVYEHTHYFLIEATTIKSATKKAKDYASSYYCGHGNVEPDESGIYRFNDGDNCVRICELRETTKEQWLEEAFIRSMID